MNPTINRPEAPAEEEHPVLELNWHPSRWGAKDQVGSGNLLSAAKVLEATALIRAGRIVRLGYPYDDKMPMAEGRQFSIRMPGGPTGAPEGTLNGGVWNDDFVATDLGQIGTHMDALGHFGCRCGARGDNRQILFYNGNALADMWAPYGLKRLGIENAPTFFTRCVFFDVPAFKGRDLAIGEEITDLDLKGCLARQGLRETAIRPGDAVIIRTGYAERFIDQQAVFYKGAPGIGLDAARWLSAQEPCVIGADNFGIEMVPPREPGMFFPCHQHLITQHGIYLHENMKLDELAEAGVYEFAYVFSPLPVVGATGSVGTPIAVF